MVNAAVSAIVAVNQSPIKIVVVGRGGTIKLMATPARIGSMFLLLVRTIAKHD